MLISQGCRGLLMEGLSFLGSGYWINCTLLIDLDRFSGSMQDAMWIGWTISCFDIFF